jgi:heme oxygenase
MSASKGSLHERLRTVTRPLHDELERAVNIGERLASRQRYAGHLARLWGLHAAAEKALQALDFSHLGFIYPAPYRSALIEEDLAYLGIPADVLRRTDLPTVPRLETIPAGLGCLYVLEGSAKGARAILPDIRAALGLDAERGAKFFYGFGRETGELWRACMTAINDIDPASVEADRTVETATGTFLMFREGLVATDDGALGLPGAPDQPKPRPAYAAGQAGP